MGESVWVSVHSLISVQIRVKVEDLKEHDEEPLIAELAYIINRLHRDMYLHHSSDVPIIHEVVVPVEKQGMIAGVVS